MSIFNLKEFREKTGLTQSELSERLGVSRSIVAKVEKGDIEISKRMKEKLELAFPQLKNENLINKKNTHLFTQINTHQNKNFNTESISYTVESNHPIFEIVDTFQIKHTEIELYLKKFEDLEKMCVKLHNPLAENIAKYIQEFKKFDIKGAYSDILKQIVIVEPIRQNEPESEELKKFDNSQNKLITQLLSAIEQLKVSYEGFYDLFKEWILKDLFVEYILEAEKQKTLNLIKDFLNKKNITASDKEIKTLYNQLVTDKEHKKD